MAHISDPTCIFCKIVAGQIPCWKIFEDEIVLAFLDIGPLVTGHTLVVPKSHVPNIMHATPEVLAAMTSRIPIISRAVLAATGTHACNLLVNNGSEAQQSIPHLHFHILPRKPQESFHIPWNASTLDKAAAVPLLAAIKEKLTSQS